MGRIHQLEAYLSQLWEDTVVLEQDRHYMQQVEEAVVVDHHAVRQKEIQDQEQLDKEILEVPAMELVLEEEEEKVQSEESQMVEQELHTLFLGLRFVMEEEEEAILMDQRLVEEGHLVVLAQPTGVEVEVEVQQEEVVSQL